MKKNNLSIHKDLPNMRGRTSMMLNKSGKTVLHLHVTLRIRLPFGDERKNHSILDKKDDCNNQSNILYRNHCFNLLEVGSNSFDIAIN